MIEVTRRGFLAGLSAATAGLALGIHRAEAGEVAPRGEFHPNPWIQIGTDGIVVIICHRSEMGQGIRSTLPVLIADELGADPKTIQVAQGDGDNKYGDQNTDGSTSIRKFYDDMRMVGATARSVLIAAAAKTWRVPEARLVAVDSVVRDPVTGKQLTFAQLALAASKLPVPKRARLRDPKDFKYVGKELPLREGRDFVTGKAMYGADVTLPGMLTAVIARPPAVFGDVTKLDDSKAKQVPGVRHVIRLPAATPPAGPKPLGGVAVIADHTWAALRGRAALDITWNDGPNGAHDSATYEQALLASVRAPGKVVRQTGDVDKALASAATKLEAEYIVPQLAHAAMEPPAALARVDGDKIEIWTCTQSPQDARDAVADAMKVDKSKVTIHVTFLGGGFGRKSVGDYAIEAALLAKQVGKPVRVQWSREDDLRHDLYHAPSVQGLAAGLDAKGKITAWRHRVAYPAIPSLFDGKTDRASDGEMGLGVTDLPISVPNVRAESGPAPAHVRIGWLRSVANIQQAFAIGSFVDEIAHATRRDPKALWLELLAESKDPVTTQSLGVDKLRNYGAPLDKHPISRDRYRTVIEAVTRAASWSDRSGRALGFAVHRSFLSYIGVIVEMSKGARGELRVDEAWIAADCGLVVNPDRVRSQLEGALIFGQSIAFHNAITMKRGAVEQTNFRDYPLVRMPEVPRAIHVELLPSKAPPGGVGEPGVPPVAPAIANAVFALTGKRIRVLPFARSG